MANELQDMGVHSICIKDMAGLLKPYECEELVTRLKESIEVPIAMHCHATTGLSTATYQKAIDAGIDILDTSISSMSMTYGHTATETVVSIVEGTERDTGLALPAFTEIASYFRDVRKKYTEFEGSLKGVDARILIAQVPGGMLTNMESQLKEQGAEDKMDEVLLEIPKVREDLGFIPLVTPTSQIVGTQSVINVITGERYKSISKETAGVLKGEYGATAAPVNAELQLRVLEGKEAITCRPADLIEDELAALTTELTDIAQKESIQMADDLVDDVLTYALFPQIGLKFLKNRNNPAAFEPAPGQTSQVAVANTASPESKSSGAEAYSVRVDGQVFQVEVSQNGELTSVQPSSDTSPSTPAASVPSSTGQALNSPLAGNIFKVLVKEGQSVNSGDVVVIMEAMKMETEIRASVSGVISNISTKEGDAVQTGQPLLVIG
jgi:oxaloacetate decarboxylase alpha subunit